MRRDEVLAEMGLPQWTLRDYRGALPAGAQRPERADEAGPQTTALQKPVNNFQKNATPAALAAPSAPGAVARKPRHDHGLASEGDWAALEAEIRACRACGLCKGRKQAVPGIGDREADWLFIGEGPGAEEDEQGEPFVGQAGKLLDAMLRSIGLVRGEGVYIANAVKCRPPGNRTPEPAEVSACRPYLERQVALLRPKLIVLLGRAAAQAVLRSDETLSSMRGRSFAFGDIPVLVTYHPAYLLRTPLDKAKTWEDLCRAKSLMRGGEKAP